MIKSNIKNSFACLGILLLLGCAKHTANILGNEPQGTSIKIAALESADVSKPVVLHGVMVEKCPVAGCWFNLRDDSGLIKVDTKAANFVVLNVPLQTTVMVSGHLTTNGSQKMLEATGLSY